MADGSIPGAEKKIVAGVLAILVGVWGVHKFYLGYTKEGIIQILLNVCFGFGALLAFIEGVLYLTKSDQEFVDTYVNGRKGWL